GVRLSYFRPLLCAELVAVRATLTELVHGHLQPAILVATLRNRCRPAHDASSLNALTLTSSLHHSAIGPTLRSDRAESWKASDSSARRPARTRRRSREPSREPTPRQAAHFGCGRIPLHRGQDSRRARIARFIAASYRAVTAQVTSSGTVPSTD